MDETTGEDIPHRELPFNNLFLNSGYVSGFNDWWIYLITIGITIMFYLLGQVIAATPLLMQLEKIGLDFGVLADDPNKLFDAEFMQVDKNLVLLLLLSMFVITAAGFVLCIRKLHKKNLTSLFTGFEKFRFKRFWFAFTVWGGLIVISIVGSYLVNPSDFTVNFNLTGFLISTVMMLFLMPVQTGFEEVFFRGYLMQGLGQAFKSGLAPLVVTSLLFGAVHMSNPEAKEYGRLIMLTYYVLFALFMGGITLLDEGLELAFGIHFANNFISSVMVSAPGSVLRTYSIFDAKSASPYDEIVAWLCMALVSFLIFKYRFGWKNFRLILN